MKRSGPIFACVVALTLLCASARGGALSSLREVGRNEHAAFLAAPVFSPAGQVRTFGQTREPFRAVQPSQARITAPLVTKYRHASAPALGRLPAADRAASTRLNRFVFHRAPPRPPVAASSVATIGETRADER